MGFGWERTLWIWGLVRAVGGSGNTSNVHQGTLSTLSLSQPAAPSSSRPLAKLDAPRISLRSGVTNLFLCNRLSLIFLTFMFTYVHILYAPHPTGWKGFHFLWNFLAFTRKILFISQAESLSLHYHCRPKSGCKLIIGETVKAGQFSTSIWSMFGCVFQSCLWVMLWVRCSRKDQICS